MYKKRIELSGVSLSELSDNLPFELIDVDGIPLNTLDPAVKTEFGNYQLYHVYTEQSGETFVGLSFSSCSDSRCGESSENTLDWKTLDHLEVAVEFKAVSYRDGLTHLWSGGPDGYMYLPNPRFLEACMKYMASVVEKKYGATVHEQLGENSNVNDS